VNARKRWLGVGVPIANDDCVPIDETVWESFPCKNRLSQQQITLIGCSRKEGRLSEWSPDVPIDPL
jgi:hypothetical protein